MERRTAIRNLILAAAAPLVSRGAAERAQDGPEDYVIRSEVRLVLLDVSVKDRGGAFVGGLTQSNFQVFENGVRQSVTFFADSDLPVTVGILVDESFSMARKRAEVLYAAGIFITASNPRDEIFVFNFNDTVKAGLPDDVPFSDDIVQLRAALSRGTPQGRTALNDAVVSGLRHMELGKRDKKALIVISDGGDNASRHTRREMLDMVDGSIATIYAIGLFDGGDEDRDPGVLKRLATASGGEAFFPAEPSRLADVCRQIAKDIRTRYTLGYVPAAHNGGPLRHIRVNVSALGRAGLTARTRAQYRYDEVANAASR